MRRQKCGNVRAVCCTRTFTHHRTLMCRAGFIHDLYIPLNSLQWPAWMVPYLTVILDTFHSDQSNPNISNNCSIFIYKYNKFIWNCSVFFPFLILFSFFFFLEETKCQLGKNAPIFAKLDTLPFENTLQITVHIYLHYNCIFNLK